MTEIWKEFPLDSRYSISTFGRVKGPRKILSLQHDKDGYPVFMVWSSVTHPLDGKRCKLHKVHRAVAQTFIGAIPPGMVINHLNGVKQDNHLNNLQITTISDNTQHGFTVLNRKVHLIRAKGEKHGNSKLSEKDVLEIRRRLSLGESQKDLAAEFKTPKPNISAIHLRKAWKHI